MGVGDSCCKIYANKNGDMNHLNGYPNYELCVDGSTPTFADSSIFTKEEYEGHEDLEQGVKSWICKGAYAYFCTND